MSKTKRLPESHRTAVFDETDSHVCISFERRKALECPALSFFREG